MGTFPDSMTGFLPRKGPLLHLCSTSENWAYLQCLQERDKIVLVLLRQVQIETRVVEIDSVHQCGGGAVVEIGRSSCETPQDRALDLGNVVEPAID